MKPKRKEEVHRFGNKRDAIPVEFGTLLLEFKCIFYDVKLIEFYFEFQIDLFFSILKTFFMWSM